jgi:uncharacterized small protein (DUF1192 family)
MVVMCGQVAQTYIKQRAKRSEPNEDLEQTLLKIDELEERIQVLERIVTEKRYDLKKEIDRL